MAKDEIVFDKKSHAYRWVKSGMVIPSVTQIIGSVFPFNGRGLAVERASSFGEAVHKAIELDMQRKLNWGSLDNAIIPYI